MARCRAVARGGLAGADYTFLCTLLAAGWRLSLASCWMALRWELFGTDVTYLCTLWQQNKLAETRPLASVF
jgi:hypothetical protein